MASKPLSAAPLSFRKLMGLEEMDMLSDGLKTFRSIALAWAPGALTTAFGGHVYAQAAWAASRTVRSGMIVHVCLVLQESTIGRNSPLGPLDTLVEVGIA
jgi:hypothetical protein